MKINSNSEINPDPIPGPSQYSNRNSNSTFRPYSYSNGVIPIQFNNEDNQFFLPNNRPRNSIMSMGINNMNSINTINQSHNLSYLSGSSNIEMKLNPLNINMGINSNNPRIWTAFNNVDNNSNDNNNNDNNVPLMNVGMIYNTKYNSPASTDQCKTPLSPSLYSNSHTSTNTRRDSLIYPLTPQTVIAQQDQSPLVTSVYKGNSSNNNGYNYRYWNESKVCTAAIEGSNFCKDGNKKDIITNFSGQAKKLYFDLPSKTYVYKTEEEAVEGLNNETLFLHRQGDNGNGKKKKLSDNDNDSDSEDDDDSDDSEDDDPGNKRTKIKRSRTGCMTCRMRKKRCCESKPRCSECVRLNIACRWPVPGKERKNKSKNHQRISHDEMYHEVYGVIKVLRGVIDHKIEQ